jgi:hypothetical protein
VEKGAYPECSNKIGAAPEKNQANKWNAQFATKYKKASEKR